MTEPLNQADLTRSILGIENRSAQEVFDIMCDRIRLRPTPPPVEAQIAVKPLTWEEGKGNYEGQTVWSPENDIWPCWIVRNEPGVFVWSENIGIDLVPASPVRGRYETLEAAQADYETRIRSALSTIPAKPVGTQAGQRDGVHSQFRLVWTAAARPPVHLEPMTGRQTLASFEAALRLMKSQPADSVFVSLKQIDSYSVDRTADFKAALQGAS